METASYFQPVVAFFTAAAIRVAVISGPEGILIGSLRPVTLTLMLVPPTSITRTFIDPPPYPSPRRGRGALLPVRLRASSTPHPIPPALSLGCVPASHVGHQLVGLARAPAAGLV